MSYYNDPVVPKSITKEVRKELGEALRINNQLRSEVDRLAAELATARKLCGKAADFVGCNLYGNGQALAAELRSEAAKGGK